jgi:hypothetical protein
MSVEPRDRHFGSTISEYMALMPGELSIDAVGLWQIVPVGRHDFGLEGAELVAFVRRALYALVGRGARPVLGGRGTEYAWVLQPQYGSTNQEIVEGVMAEWLAGGAPDPGAGDLWFALPDVYQAKASVQVR